MYKMMLIAPYEGLCKLVESRKAQYRDFTITVEMGDLEKGVEIARRAEHAGYDIILSRGGTAEIIEKNTMIPVVALKISGYDMLRVIRLAQHYSGTLAIVGFPHITQSAETACRLLGAAIDIYTINSETEAECLLYELGTRNYEAFIGDVTIGRVANRLGLNAILITSGAESLDEAIEEARRILQPLKNLRKRNRAWEQLIEELPQAVVLTDKTGNVIYRNRSAATFDELDSLIHTLYKQAALRPIESVQSNGGELYHVRSFSLENDLICFLIERETIDESLESGISFQISETDRIPFGYLSTKEPQMKRIIEDAKVLAISESPVLIWGEHGTGRDQLAYSIHLFSHWGNSQFITFDCQLLEPSKGDKVYRFLCRESQSTWYFRNLQCMSRSMQELLANMMQKEQFNSKHRLICSCDMTLRQRVREGTFSEYLFSTLSSHSLYLPTLQQRKQDIADICSLAISNANIKYGKQVAVLKEDALQALVNHQWSGNIEQLTKLVDTLVLNSIGDVITRKSVEEAFSHEPFVNDIAPSLALNLNQSLDKIIDDIIDYVMKEENNNQVAVAKRLCISRSTLWRRLKGLKE